MFFSLIPRQTFLPFLDRATSISYNQTSLQTISKPPLPLLSLSQRERLSVFSVVTSIICLQPMCLVQGLRPTVMPSVSLPHQRLPIKLGPLISAFRVSSLRSTFSLKPDNDLLTIPTTNRFVDGDALQPLLRTEEELSHVLPFSPSPGVLERFSRPLFVQLPLYFPLPTLVHSPRSIRSLWQREYLGLWRYIKTPPFPHSCSTRATIFPFPLTTTAHPP